MIFKFLIMAFFENFPYPSISDGKIETLKFLEASKGIVKFVELLGTVFAPVKHDINGNIQKLYQLYRDDETKFEFLNDIFEFEECSDKDKGVDALLWLKRALEYVHTFLLCVVEDKKQGSCTENLSPFFHKAYEEKLQKYHGWFIQKIFGIIVLAAPSRKTLLDLLANGKEALSEDEILKDMDSFQQGLGTNLEVINQLYTTHNLDSNQIV